MAGESYTTKKILLKAVDGSTTQYFIPYVNNATTDKAGLVKPDGTTITITEEGVISAVAADISGLVPNTRTVNGKALSSNITLNGADIALTGYTKASSAADVAATDTVNQAIGKLQKTLDGKQASGDYADASHTHTKSEITDFPTIPTVNNGKITIQKNGTKVNDFTLNQSTDTTINITVPTQASDINAAASSHSHVGSEVTLTGYTKASSASAVAATDTVNQAFGKLQKAIEGKQDSGNYVPTSRTINSKALSANITLSASDVGAAASSHTHGKADITDFPTIPTVTDTYSGTSSDAMSGKAVKSAIDGAIASTYKPAGSVAFANRPTPAKGIEGNVYNVTDAFTVTSDFVEYESGVTKTYPAGTNIVCINTSGTTYKYDVLAGFVNLSGYQLVTTSVTHPASDAVGSATKPVYVNSTGAATECTYELNKSVPSDAVFTDTVYTHPTTSGNKHIPSGGSSGKILKWSSDGTATWETEYSYTHPTSAGNKHVPTGGSSGQVLVYGGSSGTASWGAVPSHTHDYVPTARTVNSKALSSDITLTASDVGALPDSTEIPSKVSDLENDTGFITGLSWDNLTGKPSTFTPSSHNQASNTINALTSYSKSVSGGTGALSTSDTLNKALAKLENALDGKQASGSYAAASHTHVGSEVALTGYAKASSASAIAATDTVNQALGKVEKALDGKQGTISDIATIRTNASNGAAAATTIAGYGDIVTHDADEFLTEHQDISGKANTADLGAAAFSNSYNDLDNKPTIPTVNNATLTIQKNGTTVKTFTANASSNVTCNITVPTAAADIGAATSDHTHSGYVPTSRTINSKALSANISLTASDVGALPSTTSIPSKTSDLTNDSGFITGVAWGDVTGKPSTFTPSSHNQASSTINALTNYSKSVSGGTGALSTSDTLNKALAKLENAIDGKQGTVSDIATIRTNAEAGASAATTIAGYGDIVTHDADEFAEASHTHSGYVPTSRTINSKALTGNITLSASDVGAAASSHTHTKSQITDFPTIPTITDTYSATSSNGMSGKAVASAISGKANSATSLSGYGITDAYTKTEIDGMVSAGMHYKGSKTSYSNLPTTGNQTGDLWNVTDTGANYAWNGTGWDKMSETIDLSGYVPTSRTINSKALTGNISLTASDVGAATSDHTHSNYVPTSRTINSKALTGNITLSASDVGALPSTTSIPSKTSDLTNDSGFITGVAWGDVTGKPSSFTPSSHNQASSTINALTSYSKSVSGGTGALSTSDTLNKALAKLENALDGKQASGSYAPATHTHTKSQITDFPTIPTITDTYSATSSNGMSGKAVASAIGGITPAGIGAATSDHTHSGYVPTSRTINSKALTSNISLTASDVGAAASDHTHSGYVPTSRTINSKALTSNISLTASDVGALPDTTSIPSKTSDLTNDSGFITSYTDTKNTAGTTNKTGTKMYLAAATSQGDNPQTYSNSNCYIGTDNCLYSGGTKVLTAHQSLSGYVPTSRTINSKALTGNISLTASDVGALPDTTSIPTKVSDLTNDAGYTTNAGTITGIKMNGSSKGTSGVVDLGTVITSQYVHPTTSGNKHIPSGGSSNQVLVYSSSGTAAWGSVPSHNQASSTINAMTSYAKASSAAAIATSDSLNTAVGKLEYKVDDVDTQLQALVTILNNANP